MTTTPKNHFVFSSLSSSPRKYLSAVGFHPQRVVYLRRHCETKDIFYFMQTKNLVHSNAMIRSVISLSPKDS